MNFDLRTQLHRIFAVDLTQIPGVDTLTAHAIFTEVGRDLSRFPNAAAFASWMGLCPDHRVGGGKIRHTQTCRVNNRVARALYRYFVTQMMWYFTSQTECAFVRYSVIPRQI